jgi:hypothetical protein
MRLEVFLTLNEDDVCDLSLFREVPFKQNSIE